MIRTFLAFMCVFVMTSCFGHEINMCLHDDAIEQIAANEINCVQGYENDKIYLKPSSMYPSEHGLYLNLNGVDFIRLSNVSSDDNGCFVIAREIFNRCPFCRQLYFVKCKNPQCPGKPKS